MNTIPTCYILLERNFFKMEESISTIIQFCPIPIYQGKINLQSADIDNFLSLKLNRLKQNDGYFSEDTKLLHNEKFSDVKKRVESHLYFFAHNFLGISKLVKFELQNSWMIKHTPEDYAPNHFHENSIFSGIFYLKVNQNSGELIFKKNSMWENIFPKSLNLPIEQYNNFNCKEWKILPEPGDIIIFPSHLDHRVNKNLSGEDRYSVAFNFFPRCKLGQQGSFVELTV